MHNNYDYALSCDVGETFKNICLDFLNFLSFHFVSYISLQTTCNFVNRAIKLAWVKISTTITSVPKEPLGIYTLLFI